LSEKHFLFPKKLKIISEQYGILSIIIMLLFPDKKLRHFLILYIVFKGEVFSRNRKIASERGLFLENRKKSVTMFCNLSEPAAIGHKINFTQKLNKIHHCLCRTPDIRSFSVYRCLEIYRIKKCLTSRCSGRLTPPLTSLLCLSENTDSVITEYSTDSSR